MNHRAMFFRWLSALALSAVCACGSSRGNAPTASSVQGKESAIVAPVVQKYKTQGVLTGFDFKGAASLLVFADSEKYSELDDATEAAMKSELLQTWARAWKGAHGAKHARLLVIIQNYYGQEISRLQKQV